MSLFFPSKRLTAWLAAASAVMVFVVFSDCLQNGFVWDDEQFILKNLFLTSVRYLPALVTQNIIAGAGYVSNLYRPVQSLTHFLDVRLWGYLPFGHHLTNVLLQAALAAALFRLLASLFPLWPAFFAALVFTLHPLQSEAVAYVSGRGDLLAMLFPCLTLLAFERSMVRALFFGALAVLSKESMALLPVFLFLYEWARGRRFSARHWPFWGLSALYGVMRLTALNFQNTMNFYNASNVLTENLHFRIFTYVTTIPKAFALWFWPFDLHHERSWKVYASLAIPAVWASLLVIAVIFILAMTLKRTRRSKIFLIGALWFFAATVPTSNVPVVINALFYDHWFILPGLGLTLILCEGLSRLWEKGRNAKRLVCVAIAALLAALLPWTRHYNRVWRDTISLYSHILRWEPQSAKICDNLGMAYADQGDVEQAIRFYKRGIELDDAYPQVHHNLALAYRALGRTEASIEEYRRALAMDPAFHHSWLNLGVLNLSLGRLDEAEEALHKTIRLYPYEARAYAALAKVYWLKGEREKAASIIHQGFSALPDHPFLTAFAKAFRNE